MIVKLGTKWINVTRIVRVGENLNYPGRSFLHLDTGEEIEVTEYAAEVAKKVNKALSPRLSVVVDGFVGDEKEMAGKIADAVREAQDG